MRILFLGEPDSPNTISWVEGLREQGCEVFLASVRTDGNDGHFPIGHPVLPPRVRVLTGNRGLKRLIQEIKPDLLIAYRITSYGYLAARSGFHPLVIAAQNEQIVYLPKPSYLRSRFLGRCAKFAIDNADLIHSWAGNITKGLLKFNADEKKILTMHRGIDMTPFKVAKGMDKGAEKVSSPHRFPNTEYQSPIFISTRSLAPEYEINKVIDAFKIVIAELPEARLEIVGSGTEEENLKKQVSKLDLGQQVTFYGKVSKKKVVELLKESDIYVSIIQTEGISSSLIECIAAEVLPIVADMPASKELVEDDNNGFLITQTKPEVLSEVMLRAVDALPGMQKALVENKFNVINHFDRNKNQQAFVKKYEDIIAFYASNPVEITN